MFYVVQFRRPKWWPWDEVVYLNESLMEMVSTRDMASVYTDKDTAENQADFFKSELLDGQDKWELHIVRL